jgi:hypothetical protein
MNIVLIALLANVVGSSEIYLPNIGEFITKLHACLRLPTVRPWVSLRMSAYLSAIETEESFVLGLWWSDTMYVSLPHSKGRGWNTVGMVEVNEEGSKPGHCATAVEGAQSDKGNCINRGRSRIRRTFSGLRNGPHDWIKSSLARTSH